MTAGTAFSSSAKISSDGELRGYQGHLHKTMGQPLGEPIVGRNHEDYNEDYDEDDQTAYPTLRDGKDRHTASSDK